MLTPVVPLRPRKNPPRRYARLGPPPAPPVVNQIVSVTLGSSVDQIRVKLTAVLTGFDDVDQMLGVSADGEDWAYPFELEGDDEGNVTFVFAGNVSGATQWRVPEADNYHFADGLPLVEPFNGNIE